MYYKLTLEHLLLVLVRYTRMLRLCILDFMLELIPVAVGAL